MANFKRYPIIGASKYEVTHDGKVINRKKDTEMGIRKDGRVKITNDEGKQIYITASVEYGRARFEDGRITIRRVGKIDPPSEVDDREIRTTLNFFELGSDYPNYYITRKAEIFHKDNPNEPLQHYENNRVYLYNASLKTTTNVSRFKMFAIYVLGQQNIGPVHVEYFYFMYESKNMTNATITRNDICKAKETISNGTIDESVIDAYSSVVHGRYCGNDPLTEKRVQIIPDKIKYFRYRLLEFYKGVVFVFENRQEFYILDIKTGNRVERTVKNGGINFKLYRIKQIFNIDAKKYDYVREVVMVPMNKLHLDPRKEDLEIIPKIIVF